MSYESRTIPPELELIDVEVLRAIEKQVNKDGLNNIHPIDRKYYESSGISFSPVNIIVPHDIEENYKG